MSFTVYIYLNELIVKLPKKEMFLLAFSNFDLNRFYLFAFLKKISDLLITIFVFNIVKYTFVQ